MDKAGNYGAPWGIVAICFMTTMCVGEVMFAFGVFFTALENDFAWNRSVISGGYTALIVGHSISAVIAGKLADKHAAGTTLSGSAVLAGISISLCAFISASWQYYCLFFLAGLGTGAAMAVPASTVLRWFEGRPHGSIALATVMAGIGTGGLIFAPLFQSLLSIQGWRLTFVVAGLAYLVMVGTSGLFISKQKLDQKLDQKLSGNTGSRDIQKDPSPPLYTILGSKAYILLLGITTISFLTFQVMSVHVVPLATDAGIPLSTAALALGLIGGASIPGRFLAGILAEQVGWNRTLQIALGGEALAIACLGFISQTWLLYTLVALFGLCHGMRAVTVMGLLGALFGTSSLGILIGLTIAFGQLLAAPGPYLAGFWFDLWGSYALTFGILASLLILGVLMVHRSVPERVA